MTQQHLAETLTAWLPIISGLFLFFAFLWLCLHLILNHKSGVMHDSYDLDFLIDEEDYYNGMVDYGHDDEGYES